MLSFVLMLLAIEEVRISGPHHTTEGESPTIYQHSGSIDMIIHVDITVCIQGT